MASLSSYTSFPPRVLLLHRQQSKPILFPPDSTPSIRQLYTKPISFSRRSRVAINATAAASDSSGNSNPSSPAKKLREIMQSPGVLQGPCCFDALSAKLVERAGFPYCLTTGLSISAARVGLPDKGLISYGEMVDQGQQITQAVSIPVIGDGGNGFGNAINVKRTVKGYIRAGFAGIIINDHGQFPGPAIEAVTNNNIVVNLINKLDEPFLITWNGIKQRRTSWQDGVLGTNCPIPPNSNWTYQFQLKDQIGTFTYFASTSMHRASGAFGALNINQRSVITTPYLTPDGDFTLLVTDWFKLSHKDLRKRLDAGYALPLPDALLINGASKGLIFTGQQGKTYKFRVSNVGIATSINFRIQNHTMTLIEVEGAHTLQESYESLDVHVGQSVTVLVTLKASVRDYYIVASSRFTKPVLNTTASLRYLGSKNAVYGPLPVGPTYHIHWSMKQARTIRMNLTANAARPNPQGSYHYGTIPINRTLVLANAATMLYGKLRYTVNRISYINPTTPLKLADWYNISGVFDFKTILSTPTIGPAHFGTSVFDIELHEFVEIVFQNDERSIQSWHMDGTSAFLVGFGSGTWNETMRTRYNLVDAVARHTFQVYPLSWTSILVSLDNKGMWNLRSQIWSRRYLGQELYVRVWNDEKSLYTEAEPPLNALYCGLAKRPL